MDTNPISSHVPGTCTNTGNLSCTPLGLAFNASTNRITTSGYTYDGAGNLLTDNTHGYVYDYENRITCVVGTDGTCTSASAVLYFYDPDGKRVGKQQGDTLEDYVYDPLGQISSVHDGSMNLLRAELYSPDGRHVATFGPNPNGQYSDPYPVGLFWNHADWLDTERVRTTVVNGTATVAETCTDTPYGMNLNCIDITVPADTSPTHFTGKQRDNETGLDFFDARYYGSPMGRFMTPDWSASPEAVPYAHLEDPQSLNLYGYERNNPLLQPDLDGHGCPPDCSTGDPVVDFVSGLVNAWGSDNLMGAGRTNQTTTAGQLGQTFGDAGATLQGGAETVLGAGGEVLGFTLDATGVGALVGVPANVVSTGAILDGSATATIGGANLAKDANQTSSGGPKAKDAPGVTAGGQATDEHGNKLGPSGETQIDRTTSTTREGARNRALNEGSGAVEHSNPKQGKPHFHPADSEGNKKPSSAHHEYPE
jgi:RHS repeat-associated protein